MNVSREPDSFEFAEAGGGAMIWGWDRFQDGIPAGYDAVHCQLHRAVARDGPAALAAADSVLTGPPALLARLAARDGTARRRPGQGPP